MRLLMTVEHSRDDRPLSVVELDSRDPLLLEAAADAFRAFAFAARYDTEISIPGRDGVVVVQALDIDRFDLSWEA